MSDIEASEGEIEIVGVGVGVSVEAMMASEMAASDLVVAVTASMLEKESSLAFDVFDAARLKVSVWAYVRVQVVGPKPKM